MTTEKAPRKEIQGVHHWEKWEERVKASLVDYDEV